MLLTFNPINGPSLFAEVYDAIKKTAEDANRDLSSSGTLGMDGTLDLTQATLRQVQRDGCHVLLLCAPTPDAVCATRMLCQLLLADGISHRLRPVAGYSDIDREIKRSTESSIVLLGCGVSFHPFLPLLLLLLLYLLSSNYTNTSFSLSLSLSLSFILSL